MERKNKLTEGKIILGVLFFFLIDSLCALLDLIPGGGFISPIIQTGASLVTTWLFWLAGDKGATKFSRQFIKYSVNILPLLPTLTITFLVEAYKHNRSMKIALI